MQLSTRGRQVVNLKIPPWGWFLLAVLHAASTFFHAISAAIWVNHHRVPIWSIFGIALGLLNVWFCYGQFLATAKAELDRLIEGKGRSD
jgi:hypothetical protein